MTAGILKSSLKKSSIAGSVTFKPSIPFNHIGVNLFSNVYENQYLIFSTFSLGMSYQLKLIFTQWESKREKQS